MKINISPNISLKRKGFTLIELLVSMTVTMVIIVVLMAMTRVAVNGMQASQNATRYSRISQSVLSTVTKDLEGIVIRSGNDYEWVSVKESNVSGAELGPGSAQMQNPIEMSFFSAVTDRYNGDMTKPGDISMVRYKLAYQDIISGSSGDYPVFSLYRKRIDPDETFEDYLSQTDLPAFTEEVTGDDFLAENIFDITISFNFEFLKSDGTTSYKRIPVQIDGEFKSLSIKGNEVLVNGSALTVSDAGAARLSSADISILILSDAGVNGLERANISSDAELAKYLREHGKLFSKSVVLPRP